MQCTLLRIVYTSGMLAAHDCRTALGQLPPGCLPRHLGPVLACQPDCGGVHTQIQLKWLCLPSVWLGSSIFVASCRQIR